MQTLIIIWIGGGLALSLVGLVVRLRLWLLVRNELLLHNRRIPFWLDLARHFLPYFNRAMFTIFFWPFGVLMAVVFLPYEIFFRKPVEPIILRSFKGPDGQIHWPNERES